MFLLTTQMCIIASSLLVDGYIEGRKVTAPEISERCNLHIRTLNVALIKLVKAGLLHSQIGGHNRGYIFTRDPKNITLYDIISITEGISTAQSCKSSIGNIKCAIEDCRNCLFYTTVKNIETKNIERYKTISIYDQYLAGKTADSDLSENGTL